jgi:hypothetical protein
MLSVLGSRASEAAEGRIWEGGVTGTDLPRLVRGMLLGFGAVGIFQWFTGLSGETLSFSRPKVGEGLVLNQLFARDAPVLSMTLGGRRRKSVLAPPSVMGIGSEMPVMVPFAVRPRVNEFECFIEDQLEPFE